MPLPSSFKRTTLLILAFVFLQQMMVCAQANEMTLTFNEQGKLLDGYLPRFKAGEGCDGLTVRVFLPLNYLNSEEESIKTRAKELSKALYDDKSMLYKIIAGCDKNSTLLTTFRKIVQGEDISKWKLNESNANEYFPPELLNYINFIDALKRGRISETSENSSELKFLKSLNLPSLNKIYETTVKADKITKVSDTNLDSAFKKYLEDTEVKVEDKDLYKLIVYINKLLLTPGDSLVHTDKLPDVKKIDSLVSDELSKLSTIKYLNAYKKFAPFQLKVSGIELDTACMNFEGVEAKKILCNCLEKEKTYVALVFKIPPSAITSKLAIDSFQLINNFPMKRVAIDWYTKAVKKMKNTDLLTLKLLDEKIRASADTITLLLNSLDTLASIDTACNGVISRQVALRQKYEAKICEFKIVLDSAVGSIEDCKDCNNIILCSKALREWVLKFMWLNGGDIKLNPFNFTLPDNLTLNQVKSRLSVKRKEQEAADAKIRLQFLDTAIVHLRDSVMRSRGISIKENIAKLDSLIEERDKVLKKVEVKETPQDPAADNEKAMKSFLTVSRVNYKGWLIPYQKEKGNLYKSPDKIWIRSYYNDQAPNYIRDKFHYTYPEDENVTLMLHNISGGTGMKVVEFMNKFADSAEFTVQAGKFVAEAAALYSSLGAIAPVVKGITQIFQKNKITDDLQNTFAEISIPVGVMNSGGSRTKNQTIAINNGVDSKNSIIARTKENLNSTLNPRNNIYARIKEIGLRYKNGVVVKQSLFIGRESVNSLQEKFDMLANIIPGADFRIPDSIVAFNRSNSEIRILIYDTPTSINEVINDLRNIRSNVDNIVLTYDSGITVKIPANVLFTLQNESTDDDKNACTDTCYLNYIATLQSIAQSPAFIDKILKVNEDTNALYYSGRFQLKDGKAPYGLSYKLLTFDVKDGSKEKLIDSSYLDVGKFVHFQTAAGLAYTPNAGFITSVDTSNGGFKISRDEDRARLIVGLRIYPWGLYKQRNPVGLFNAPFTEKRWLHRLSIMVATGIPKPLQNLYVAGGFDVVPGLNFSLGAHFQQQNSYSIQNNQVKDRRVAYRGNIFYSLTVDPQLLVTAITSLF